MKKVLIISYYWPPSGGAGVQRWLKLSKYLSRLDVEVFILTVDPEKSSYPTFDYSFTKDIGKEVKVFTTDSFEPINIYSKLVGKDKVPSAGFSNVNNTKFSQRLVTSLRSNLFIPDPRIGWNKYAYKKAVEIIDKYNINNLITTSPPHSTQLIGVKLKQKFKSDIHWISDLRDPWTDIYYYNLLNHSKRSHAINLKLEKKVIIEADKIVTVSKGVKEIFVSKLKSNEINQENFHVIYNGFDPEDFEDINNEKYRNKTFTIRYTGTMSEIYEPDVFLEVLGSFVKNNLGFNFVFECIGVLSEVIEDKIKAMDIPYNYISTVPHNEIVNYQAGADLLLLVVPNVSKSKGIVTGKIFEYLASGIPIVGIAEKGNEVYSIIEDAQSGQVFDRSEISKMENFIKSEILKQTQSKGGQKRNVEKYSRVNQAKKYYNLLLD